MMKKGASVREGKNILEWDLVLKALEEDAVARLRSWRRVDDLDTSILAVFRRRLLNRKGRLSALATGFGSEGDKTDAKDHGEALDAAHVRRLEVANGHE
jgi:hypothetical protein